MRTIALLSPNLTLQLPPTGFYNTLTFLLRKKYLVVEPFLSFRMFDYARYSPSLLVLITNLSIASDGPSLLTAALRLGTLSIETRAAFIFLVLRYTGLD